MYKKEMLRLISGFRKFHGKFYEGEDHTYEKLARGQGPKTLIIGCSDSRVDPAILSSSGPGDLFVVRNIANLVPPYEIGGGRHGVSAAIEFAVVNLKVENVIVLGHRQCGGIHALLFPEGPETKESFVQQWMAIATPAKERAIEIAKSKDREVLWRTCELESIRTSVGNLHSFPFVETAIKERGMDIRGIYFDIETGELLELDEAVGSFSAISV